MKPDLSILVSLSGFREWLASNAWKSDYDRASLQRSGAYASSRMIQQLKVSAGDSNSSVIVSAMIHGSAPKPYLTDVIFKSALGQWTADPDCSCPVGFTCKHSAALISFIAAELAAAPDPSLPRVTPELLDWMKEIELAAQANTPAEPLSKPENRFLAYCIERPKQGDATALNFVLRVGTHLKDDGIQISESRAMADPARPARYMAREDLAVTAIYHQRYRKLRLWDSMPFRGSDWDDILDGAHATGRLFFGAESNRGKFGEYRRVVLGPPLPVTAGWEMAVDGSARPMLRCVDPDFIVIPTQPPRYLDPATATLGLLESDLPAELLGAWHEGPVVSAGNIAAVSERLSAIPTAIVPTPAEIESELREKSPPRPHLRVLRRSFGDHWQKFEVITGQLSFQYLDSPLIPPLAPGAREQYAELRGNRRVVWPRSIREEAACEKLLRETTGLAELSHKIPRRFLDAEGLHSFIPPEQLAAPEIVWLDLLDGPAMQQLGDAGWTIEIDPKSGLVAHDAGDFLPVLESDPSHGIDWFRFDITFDLNGSKVSFIPLIAQAIGMNLPPADAPDLPEFLTLACEKPADGFVRFPARRLIEMVEQVRHLFHAKGDAGPLRIDRVTAAGVADTLALDTSATVRALAELGRSLKNITALPPAEVPSTVRAELRAYQHDGYRWLQFLAGHGLHGILADDMGLGKTLQTLVHLAAEHARKPGLPSLVVAPTSVVPNWASEAAKFTPHLKIVTLQGKERAGSFKRMGKADIVLTSYPLLARDFPQLLKQQWHAIILDEAQYIKNPKAISAQNACMLKSAQRICLSGTPMENHLGELWSLMRFLMPGFLSDEKTFNAQIRRPIERDRSREAQLALNRRVAPLILRRTKDQVATELPPKTELIHGIDLTKKQADLYESVRAAMDRRVREAIAGQGLAKSHIIVLDALLKLRQICCHPQLLKTPAAQNVVDSAKLDYLTEELLPTLVEEGRRILLFSTFTSMLAIIEAHLVKTGMVYLKLTGQTKDRAPLVARFQTGTVPIFLISLKAGGTGLNLTAADTVIHYDPWWNPAAENQATDRAHRIGQNKPVFVHKLVCRGTIEDRILELQKHKAALVEALLSDETGKLRIDAETLSHLLAPLD